MLYLIDTHILIWALTSPDRLSTNIKNLLEQESIFISQISFFEIAIKQTLGKLPEFALSTTALIAAVEEDGFNLLSIQSNHIDSYPQLPLLQNHRDPFDRLLLATALSENMAIISADSNFKFYQPQIRLISND